MLSGNYSLFSLTLSSKNNKRYSKKICKYKCACFNRIIWLIWRTWGWKWKVDHRYNINRLRVRHGHKYTKYRIRDITMMVICSKQHLSIIWSLIHQKAKQHWGWVEKICCLQKTVYHRVFAFLSLRSYPI